MRLDLRWFASLEVTRKPLISRCGLDIELVMRATLTWPNKALILLNSLIIHGVQINNGHIRGE